MEREVAQNGKGIFAGFAGWIKNTTISNSRSLILNDWAVFTGFADGGKITGVAHYINKPNPTFWSAILGADRNNNKPIITNSTLLVEKENEDTWLYRTGNVSEESKDNYVTGASGITLPLIPKRSITAPSFVIRPAWRLK